MSMPILWRDVEITQTSLDILIISCHLCGLIIEREIEYLSKEQKYEEVAGLISLRDDLKKDIIEKWNTRHKEVV